MEPNEKVTVEVLVNAPLEKAWKVWTEPEFITKWNFASDDWKCPTAKNDLRTGGRFSYLMKASDDSVGFDFSGEYTRVEQLKVIEYRIDDGRMVNIVFTEESDKTRVTETFEAENMHPVVLQRNGWQAILNNFKKLAEEEAK